MSVLIKGMEMPKDNEVKMILFPNGQVFIDSGVYYLVYEAVEVPTPHGRLIDADEFIKERNLGYECKDCIFDYKCNCDFSFTRMDICSWIEDAPTVIESEE